MLNRKINKKIKIFKIVTLVLMTIVILKLIDVQLFKNSYYQEKLEETIKVVNGISAPRGRIYDRNGVLLVDNEPIKVIRYNKLDNSKEEEELIATKLSEILNIDVETILQRMNNGYYYDVKTVKTEVSEKEYALIAEANLTGVFSDITWKRVYKTEYFKTMLGSVGLITTEKKEYYLAKGYSLNDLVGISYIEEVYDDILKGQKSKYLFKDNKYELIEEGKKGNDIYLTIDIRLQESIEKVLETEIRKAKKEQNTKYYNHSYVIISDPNNGEILAMAGKQIIDDVFYDYTPNLLVSTVTMGSSVKGASNIVGYKTGTLAINEIRKDFCIKIKSTVAKCSWRSLGTLNDVSALKYSSNSYQFQTAIKLGKGNYQYNQTLELDSTALDEYRQIFAEFGLGVKTGIDFLESVGYKGSKKESGLILDFSIGQYDTYTSMQMSQYINTIANGGKRLRPLILKGYYDDNEYISVKPMVLNEVNIDQKYLERVQLGFEMVTSPSGTGFNYINPKYKPAGKTGTSTSYIDLNKDGIVETATTTNTFVAYAPYDNPVVSFTVISPNVKLAYSGSTYKTMVNKKISYEVARKFFEIYK